MYLLNNKKNPAVIEQTTFADLNMKESDIEELLRTNIELLCDDEDESSMLIVGQQVKNAQNGRSDLTAIDKYGNLVLIEIKRDKKDIVARKEAFEFQAIRYAASCATISSTDELIQDLFAPYVEKHKTEFDQQAGLTSGEIAKRKLDDFIKINEITSFNDHQKIILVSSDFDPQTLSAVSWLNANQVDISCYQMIPFKFGQHILLDVKKLLPAENYQVNIAKTDSLEKGRKKDITRRQLPKIDAMLEWGVVLPGDIIVAKGTTEEAELLKDGQVRTTAGKMSMQQWLKGVYKWSSVQTYVFAQLKRTGRTLEEIRAEYLQQHADDLADSE